MVHFIGDEMNRMEEEKDGHPISIIHMLNLSEVE